MEKTMNARTGDYILSQAPGTRSLENAILDEGQNLEAGTVLGQIKSAVGAKISGTGDGTVGAVTLGPDAEVGTYVLTGKTEAGNAGTFSVRSPSGQQLPDLTVAAAYAGTHINLTVADGANDWDTGDVIHVTVTGGNYTQLAPAATDGSQKAAGMLHESVDATDGDLACVVFVRDGEVKAEALIWPAAITDAQKAVALDQIKARGIEPR